MQYYTGDDEKLNQTFQKYNNKMQSLREYLSYLQYAEEKEKKTNVNSGVLN
jgi:hypothetical protein